MNENFEKATNQRRLQDVWELDLPANKSGDRMAIKCGVRASDKLNAI